MGRHLGNWFFHRGWHVFEIDRNPTQPAVSIITIREIGHRQSFHEYFSHSKLFAFKRLLHDIWYMRYEIWDIWWRPLWNDIVWSGMKAWREDDIETSKCDDGCNLPSSTVIILLEIWILSIIMGEWDYFHCYRSWLVKHKIFLFFFLFLIF